MKTSIACALALVLASTAHADSYEEHDYLLSCSGCHRIDGGGSNVVPSFQGLSELADTPGAREYWIRVPGAAQAPLSDQRLAALMNWLVKRFTGKAPEPPYAGAEVGRLRREPLRDPIARRKEILTLRGRRP